MAEKESSTFGKLFKLWASYKATKGVARFVFGPLALTGAGFYLYRKFKRPVAGPSA